MSAAAERARLDLDALADEVIRLHRLVTPQQPVGAAVHDFIGRVGRDREGALLRELAAEKIRRRVEERLQEAMKRPPAPVRPERRAGTVPLRVPPAAEEVREPEVPEVPPPASAEEFKPGVVLWHTTESEAYEESAPETVPVVVPQAPAPAPQPVAEAPRPAPLPVPVPRPAPVVQQPSRRLASMRSMTPEETWGALAEPVDVGGVSKPRGDVTVQDAIARYAFARASEKDAAKQLTESQKHFSASHREFVLAGRELEALERHRAEKISLLPDYELDRLYGKRAA